MKHCWSCKYNTIIGTCALLKKSISLNHKACKNHKTSEEYRDLAKTKMSL